MWAQQSHLIHSVLCKWLWDCAMIILLLPSSTEGHFSVRNCAAGRTTMALGGKESRTNLSTTCSLIQLCQAWLSSTDKEGNQGRLYNELWGFYRHLLAKLYNIQGWRAQLCTSQVTLPISVGQWKFHWQDSRGNMSCTEDEERQCHLPVFYLHVGSTVTHCWVKVTVWVYCWPMANLM